MLTPRMRQFVLERTDEAKEIAGDSLASRWRNGDPDRKNRKHIAAAETTASSFHSRAGSVSPTKGRIPSRSPSAASKPRSGMAGVAVNSTKRQIGAAGSPQKRPGSKRPGEDT